MGNVGLGHHIDLNANEVNSQESKPTTACREEKNVRRNCNSFRGCVISRGFRCAVDFLLSRFIAVFRLNTLPIIEISRNQTAVKTAQVSAF